METKDLSTYVWKADKSMQLRVTYVAQRGGVEVIHPNGWPVREYDCTPKDAQRTFDAACAEVAQMTA